MNDSTGTANTTPGGGLRQAIQQQASSALSAQKSRAADGMTAVIEAVRQAGNQLRDKNGTLASYADNAAGQLERWSSQLRDRDISDLMDDVTTFARRRPALFVGSGVAVGLVAARFLKSSAPDNRSRSTEQPAQRFATSGPMSSAGMSSMNSEFGRTELGSSIGSDVGAGRTSSRAPRTPRSRTRTSEER